MKKIIIAFIFAISATTAFAAEPLLCDILHGSSDTMSINGDCWSACESGYRIMAYTGGVGCGEQIKKVGVAEGVECAAKCYSLDEATSALKHYQEIGLCKLPANTNN